MKKIKFTEEEWAKLNNGSKGSDEAEVPKQEISDEEILDAAARCKLYSDLDISVGSFELGARWYREQLNSISEIPNN